MKAFCFVRFRREEGCIWLVGTQDTLCRTFVHYNLFHAGRPRQGAFAWKVGFEGSFDGGRTNWRSDGGH